METSSKKGTPWPMEEADFAKVEKGRQSALARKVCWNMTLRTKKEKRKRKISDTPQERQNYTGIESFLQTKGTGWVPGGSFRTSS